jgi:hypothetical protein
MRLLYGHIMQTLAPRNGQAPINRGSLPGINPARQCRIDKVRTVFIDFPDKNWLRSVNSDAHQELRLS